MILKDGSGVVCFLSSGKPVSAEELCRQEPENAAKLIENLNNALAIAKKANGATSRQRLFVGVDSSSKRDETVFSLVRWTGVDLETLAAARAEDLESLARLAAKLNAF